MAELLVEMMLEQFASITRQQAEEGIRLIAGAGQEVERLQSNLLSIQAVLDDAENRQVKENAVSVWLAKLKDVSYDIDDVLDEWNTKLQKLKIKKAEAAFNPLKKVCSSILHYLGCRPLVMRYDIGVKIRDLDRKLDIIAKEKETFNFRSMTEGNKEIERPMTTSVVDLTQVYGREDDKNTIVDLLLSQGSCTQDLCIISIVGMGGIGKTTLAKLVFNDDKVSTHFEIKIWVCISEPFDELRIAKAILESLTNSAPNLHELETVVQNIRQKLDRKKFLLILDDVWTEDQKNWENLKSSLTCGSPESKILVTTRKEEAASAIGTTKIISLGTLLEEKCWLLFSRIAFFGKTIEESNELVEIGRKLVQKCKGLPLAVKTLASLLRCKRTFDEWQNILDSEIWEIEKVEQEVFQPLLLSYCDLPCTLKKCFLYCAIFPKDYIIDIKRLIWLWMAHGYVKSKPNEDMKLVGEEYFDTLAMRSFFQDFEKLTSSSRAMFCKMHDIVHDFAQYLTQNECYAMEVAGVGELELDSTYDRVRHSMIKIQEWASFPSSIYTRKTFLRSLMVNCNYNTNHPKIVLSKLVDPLAYLRSLFLKNCSIEEIPVEIKGLIHLRYLDLSQNDNIKKLPETLCELHNLQTLDISLCSGLRKLPQGMGNLINMRYLLNWKTSISYMPKGFERLTGLRTLGEFVISDGSYGSKACSIECLRNFKGLQFLGIQGFGKLTDAAKVKGIELINKKNLRDLSVDFEGSDNEGHDYEELLEALQPPPNLMKLRLRDYKGNTMFPNWMVSLNKLSRLDLWYCINCEHLPPLGKLSSLEILIIWGMKRVKRVGNEFLGIENDATSASSSVIAFPNLKYLWFDDMEDWEEWNYDITKRGDGDITVMLSLESLEISRCSKLTSLPNHLRQMSTLKKKFVKCPLLDEQRTDSLSSSSASYQLQQ
ncbi:putative disease resistance protein RGA3 [Mangifera indica]|uniref:putative disease resistance protein RGA3 n=1 Tax=Mangifera indica TaxID=29780 RepID=UPI001CFB916E|nr:putative disease resistance protein RGA3 [Mangifera indica]XP_044495518.1 putative disease resistance protein RGA3 [Mangifera indica]XP_044495519.1 putative disease resistance protein RGA3 [Mangifera indica]XP_044495520.1 putative disease resistance protein RGA3 [Mangifera indica]XP_044495521.1 putative disease resistance protein RGA3 [Mangifera indica]XP_044495522.1 putative disease resistance protein RGA3 [Mangifera indica]XP_044495524.1 putative disease resistance protein RGA3 [Mangifer